MQKDRSVLGEDLVIEVQNMCLAVLLVVHQRERMHGAAFFVMRLDEQADQVLVADLDQRILVDDRNERRGDTVIVIDRAGAAGRGRCLGLDETAADRPQFAVVLAILD